MKITGTAIRLGAFAVMLLFFTAVIIVVFGQMRFDRTTGYSAIFTNVSGLRNGQFVRASTDPCRCTRERRRPSGI
jgi:phospholipid/cholesterol/gamma-HCH transport system substrate-binding protein